MSNEFRVKDRVLLADNRSEKGIIVAAYRGKYKVLWDCDWPTGRTYMHVSKELMLAARV